MDLELTETQQILQRTARDFLAKELSFRHVRELETSPTGHTPELWARMADLGWLGLPFPSEYGGADGDLLDLAALVEEMGRAAAPTPYLPTIVSGLAVLHHGTEEQKRELLPRIARGELLLSPAIVEPGGGYRPESIEFVARPDGGRYVLNGTKLFVEFGHIADFVLTAARSDGALALFLVPPSTGDIMRRPMPTTGLERHTEIVFADVKAGLETLLGGPGDRSAALRDLIDLATAMTSVQLAGIAQRTLEMSVEYVSMRVQFGRPIGSFQAVQHHIANMATLAAAARLAAYEAVWKLQQGIAKPADIAYAKAIANNAREVTMTAHQLHGGIGYMKEYDLQFFSRAAASGALRYGTTDDALAEVERALGL
ncbi:MAG TPA: acyl-CoA dehydrogenase family protein [Dehalococcoidia bacterium]|nr:acyl-CoA dehydrogenase family protein [Dehalococcoidia bacterium]